MLNRIMSLVLTLGIFFMISAFAQEQSARETTLSEFLNANIENVTSICLTKTSDFLEKRTYDREKIADFFKFADSVVLISKEDKNIAVLRDGYFITIIEDGQVSRDSYAYISFNGEVDRYSVAYSRLPLALYKINDIKNLQTFDTFYNSFDDKTADDWALDRITRERFCELILGLLDTKQPNEYKNPSSLKIHFEDCSNPVADILYLNGIVSGKSEKHFDPNGLLTRQEAAKILYNLMLMYDLDCDIQPAKYDASTEYSDLNDVAEWAKDAVNAVANARIMKGDGSYFLPESPYTHQQAIVAVMRLYDAVIKQTTLIGKTV